MCKRLGNFGVPNFDAGLGGGGGVGLYSGCSLGYIFRGRIYVGRTNGILRYAK